METSELIQMLEKLAGDNLLAVVIVGTVVFAIGLLGQYKLYTKCYQPGAACLVPVWNVIVFLKIVGRPAWQMFLFLIPIYNIYFVIRVYIDLCHSFGKRKVSDYITCVLLNGLYVLNLGLSYKEEYLGPKGIPTEEMLQDKQREREEQEHKRQQLEALKTKRMAAKPSSRRTHQMRASHV